MAGRLMKVHPDFEAFAKRNAREWTVKTGRKVTGVDVTNALARAFQEKGQMHVTIVCPPKLIGRPPVNRNPFDFP